MSSNPDPNVKVGNVGTQFKCTMKKPDPDDISTLIALDLTGNSALQVEFENPKGLRSVKTGSAVSNPAIDGKIQYTDSVGIFNVRGRWKVRGVVTYSSGNKFYGSWVGFQVSD